MSLSTPRRQAMPMSESARVVAMYSRPILRSERCKPSHYPASCPFESRRVAVTLLSGASAYGCTIYRIFLFRLLPQPSQPIHQLVPPCPYRPLHQSVSPYGRDHRVRVGGAGPLSTVVVLIDHHRDHISLPPHPFSLSVLVTYLSAIDKTLFSSSFLSRLGFSCSSP